MKHVVLAHWANKSVLNVRIKMKKENVCVNKDLLIMNKMVAKVILFYIKF